MELQFGADANVNVNDIIKAYSISFDNNIVLPTDVFSEIKVDMAINPVRFLLF